jgi:hypothetical protein
MIQVRNVLIAMIDLLSGLERTLSLGSDVSVKLRGHVAQIEAYMEEAARTAQQSQVYHSVIPQYSHQPHANPPPSLDNAPPDVFVDATVPGNDAMLAGDLDLWSNNFVFDWPSDHQIALQSDLTENWPFDFGGGMYDFLGQGSSNLQVPVAGIGQNVNQAAANQSGPVFGDGLYQEWSDEISHNDV